MNVLGKTGTRSAASKKAMAKEKKEREEDLAALEKSGGVKSGEGAPVGTPTPVCLFRIIEKNS